ncbi:hypothetical protein B1R32_101149 [Abditibacterium utsteinense]|uniref:DUF5666 domain-containing protein n=1 Tax=Abditibacterium utsteinense TaxID=1960156 RepID=A0A2S8SXB5_9BACT|nr:hypothetical protein [Abditibacterium utsteinense]PQV65408.1 hypothetical protein B1R32_101149 [Abditibacterium utsteinense]
MQKVNSTRSLLALSAASLSLLPLIGAVQARPNDDAPAYGYRNQNNKNNGKNRNRPRAGKFGDIVTLEGIVTSRDDNNEFKVRAGGQTFDVRSDENVDVSEGNRVVLRGSFDGDNNFNADNVRVLGNGRNGRNPRGNNNGGYNNGGYNSDNYRNGQHVTFLATYVRALGNGQYEVRSDSGRTFRIESRDDLRARRNGDRVQVSGTFRDNRITGARLISQGSGYGGYNNGNYNNGSYNNGNYNNGSYNNGVERTVDFPARIVSLDIRNKSGVVRGGNGRTYRVVGSELNGFESGDRVRVRGVASNGVIDLRNLDEIR